MLSWFCLLLRRLAALLKDSWQELKPLSVKLMLASSRRAAGPNLCIAIRCPFLSWSRLFQCGKGFQEGHYVQVVTTDQKVAECAHAFLLPGSLTDGLI